MRNTRKGFVNRDIRRGRRLRDEQGHQQQTPQTPQMPANGGIQTPAPDNQGGNSAPANSLPAGNTNNAGQEFDVTRFWETPQEPASGDQNQPPNQTDDGQAFAQQINQQISGFQVDPVFTPEIGEQLGNGDYSGANAAIQTAIQRTLKQAVVTMAQIMQRFEADVDNRVNTRINSTVTQNRTRDQDEALLTQHFPSFKDPRTQTVVRGVFNQSLVHTKGDRTKAVEMTRNMLRVMGQVAGPDMGITEPARSPDDTYMSNNSKSLVASLLENQ